MNEVILWSQDPGVESAALAAVTDSALSVGFARCGDESELRGRLRDFEVGLVLADLGSMPLARLRQLEPLVLEHPTTRFVAACDDVTDDLVLEAMQVGARSCVAKPNLTADLPGLLARLLGGGGSTGRVVTVLSAKGGAGSSTIALGLAAELRSEDDEAMLIDLDLDYGGLSAASARAGAFGLNAILDRGDDFDGELIRSTAVDLGHGQRLLMSPAALSLDEAEGVDLDGLPALVERCREGWSTTLVDAPRLPIAAATALARASDATLIVVELSVIALRTARNIRRALIERGVPADSIVPVINRHQRRGSLLTLEDAADALDGAEPATVAFDREAARRSTDLGQPLAVVAPRSVARRDLRRLAEELGAMRRSNTNLRGGRR